MIGHRSIDVPWGVVHARFGRCTHGPTIALLHQTPRSGDEFAEVVDALGDEHHVIALDLPGMGASTPHPDGPHIDAYADAVSAALISEAVDAVMLVGHHTGAAVAATVASRGHLDVKHLVLSSPPWIDEAARQSRRIGPGIDDVVRSPDGSHIAALWNGRSSFYPDQRSDLLDRFVSDALRAVDPAEGHRAVTDWDMQSLLPTLHHIPVTLVDHARDPHAHPHIAPWRRALPQADVVEIADGMVPLEYTADAFARMLASIVSTDELPSTIAT